MAVVVTGDVLDIGGQSMAAYNAEVIFELNRPNIMATNGGLRPDKPKKVTPASDGKFSTNLEPTVAMLADAWYRVKVQWLDNAGNLIATFEFQIRVPLGGGDLTVLADLEGIGSGGRNPWLWWVGLTPPPSRGYIWNYLDPADPDRETGPIPELTLGDIVTRWW